MLIGCSIISNILSDPYLSLPHNKPYRRATSGNILTFVQITLGYFDSRLVGEISTRLAELGSIRGFLTGGLTLVLDVIFGTVYFFVLISYSGLLTAVSLCVIPLYLAMTISLRL